jgi:hypothetical protein
MTSFGMRTSSKWSNYDAGDPASTNMAENIVVNFKVMFILILLLRYIFKNMDGSVVIEVFSALCECSSEVHCGSVQVKFFVQVF